MRDAERRQLRREDQKIVLVTGKGGVGKTAVASAIALKQARAGNDTLLAELGERSFLRHVFEGYSGTGVTRVTDFLWLTRWTGDQCLREYLLHYLRVEKVVDLFFSHRAMRAFMNVAPALADLSVLGKVTSGPRGIGPDLPFNRVIVDAYSTGHFKALLMAPVGMARAIPLGPMGEQSRTIRETIVDPERTDVLLVTLPEELPVQETIELAQFLRDEFAIEPQVVINRNLKIPLDDDEMNQVQDQLRSLDDAPEELRLFLSYLRQRGAQQVKALTELTNRGLRVRCLPEVYEVEWVNLVRKLSDEASL